MVVALEMNLQKSFEFYYEYGYYVPSKQRYACERNVHASPATLTFTVLSNGVSAQRHYSKFK